VNLKKVFRGQKILKKIPSIPKKIFQSLNLVHYLLKCFTPRLGAESRCGAPFLQPISLVHNAIKGVEFLVVWLIPKL